ncbi:DNA polymerase III subunit alpha [bacterium]|nr:DNA polymerase III subunit alpha [bacterium]
MSDFPSSANNILIFDTETTGLKIQGRPPRLVQLAWQLRSPDGEVLALGNELVRPEGFNIPFNATQVHGISTGKALHFGKPLAEVLTQFEAAVARAAWVVGHNLEFDLDVILGEHANAGFSSGLSALKTLDTKEETKDHCALPGGKGGAYKWPTLTELHQKLFGTDFGDAHNAAADVDATARCLFEALRIAAIPWVRLSWTEEQGQRLRQRFPGQVPALPIVPDPWGTWVDPTEAAADVASGGAVEDAKRSGPDPTLYTPLHVHSQFSVQEAVGDVRKLVRKAAAMGIKAMALTDFDNLYGAFVFVDEARKNGIKPIVGLEIHLCRDRFDKTKKDDGYRQVLLAKNEVGYRNLIKLSSMAFSEGFYYVPRIDRELLLQYKEGLIASTGGLDGEVPSLLLNVGDREAEQAFVWWKEHFGADFYVELNRHGLPEEDELNRGLLRLCRTHKVEYYAAHESFYVEPEDTEAQEIMLCVKDGHKMSTPVGRGYAFRKALPNDRYFFDTPETLADRFSDLPESFEILGKIRDQIEEYELKRSVLLPEFDIPAEFVDPADAQDGGKRGENAYLRHLTYEGAARRYPNLTDEIRERIDFELSVIEKTGYPGYFLIVQDFTNMAKTLGVSVGPGRGSAAGSVVAYCTGITNVDPLKYGLLFERFLNPDRVSLPDIDIDFEDVGRDKVIEYVSNKYGKEKVVQIITYGSLAAKSAFRDACRVLEVPLSETNQYAKLIPDGIDLADLMGLSEKELADKMRRAEQMSGARELRKLAEGQSLVGRALRAAMKIEGALRNTGVHPCGVIIAPQDVSDLVPVMTPKDAKMPVTQFDNDVVESAGLLKMDFLGLRTLSILQTALSLIERNHGRAIDLDEIPLDDPKTLELFARGDTNALFQFESVGMQKSLRMLKPDVFDDIVAMNALYRPGPMEYIPNFANRKNGLEPITYDLPEMEEILSETYGITVYQEQVMQLSRKLGGFTRGEADKLRKAMGKKIRAQLDELKPKFMEGAEQNGHPRPVLEKIWTDWEKFAEYAFNKSHAACYSVVAFHTGYLKAHYPAEFMAAVLTHNMGNTEKLAFFLEECMRKNIPVLGPDVNESIEQFGVNRKGAIRFGLLGIKGMSETAVHTILAEREANGPFSSFTDFLKRIDTRSVNRAALQSLVLGGGFDSVCEGKRAALLHEEDGKSFLEKAMRYAQAARAMDESSQASLFGDTADSELPDLVLPEVPEWSERQRLTSEKEVLGLYLSGHPLDPFKREMRFFTDRDLNGLAELENEGPQEVSFGAMVTSARFGTTQRDEPMAMVLLEDHKGRFELRLYGEECLKFKHWFETGACLWIKAQWEVRTYPGRDGAPDGVRKKLRIQQILLLSRVMNDLTQSLSIRLPLLELVTGMREELVEMMKRNVPESGKGVPVQFMAVGEEYTLTLKTKPRMKIELSRQVFDFLESQGLEYMLK